MDLELCNASATFQRASDIILSAVMWQYAVVYLEDIVIFSRTPEVHIKHTGMVLLLFRDAGVTIKVQK